MADKAKKAKVELPEFKVTFVEGDAFKKLKERQIKPLNIHPAAISMGTRMLANLELGAKIELATKTLLESKDTIKKQMKKELSKYAKKNKKPYNVIVDDKDKETLYFYYVEKKAKEKKAA